MWGKKSPFWILLSLLLKSERRVSGFMPMSLKAEPGFDCVFLFVKIYNFLAERWKKMGFFFWGPPEECFYSGYKVPPKIQNALWVEMEIQMPGNPQLCIWEPGSSRLPDLSSLAANYVIQVKYWPFMHIK